AHVGRSWDSTEPTFAVNVRGTHHLLDALQRTGVAARVLVLSSALVYASADATLAETHELAPNSPYGLSTLAQEMPAARTTRAPGRPYNVCSGRALPIRELLDRLLARSRVPIAIKTDPARLRPNDTPLLVGDPRRLRDELGWTPAIPLERTLDDLLEFWRGEK